MPNDFVGDAQIVRYDILGFLRAALIGDIDDWHPEGNGPLNDGGPANDGIEDFRTRGGTLLFLKLVEPELHAHLRNFDIHARLDGVKNDSRNIWSGALPALSEAGASLVEEHQFFDEEGKADQAEGVGVAGDEDFLAAEDTALGGPEDVGRAVKKDKIVLLLDFLELPTEKNILGELGVVPVFAFDIDKIKGRRHEVEAGKDGFAQLILDDVADDDVFQGLLARVKDRINGTLAGGIDFVPAVEAEQPDAGIGLGVEVKKKNALPAAGQASGNIDNKRGFTDTSLVIQETDLACHVGKMM